MGKEWKYDYDFLLITHVGVTLSIFHEKENKRKKKSR